MNNHIVPPGPPGADPETPYRVMILTHGLYPVAGHTVSGNGIRAWSLAIGLIHHGFDIIYTTPEDTVHPHTPRPEVTLVPFRDVTHLQEQITSFHPDVLIIGYWAYMHLLPEDINIPIVMDLLAPWMLEAEFQENNGMHIDCLEYIQCLTRADYFMCCTHRQKAFHTAWLFLAGVNGQQYPLDIIPISTDPARMPEPVRRPDKPVTFVYGGVVWPWRSPEKWITTLLEVLAEKNQGTLQLIVGDYPLGNTAAVPREPLITDYQYAGVLEQSDLLPYDEMEQMFVNADIGIELSEKNCERELSFSFRLIEYLRCGLPVICNDFLEASDFIKKYDAGWVLNSADDQALEKLVRRIISGKENLARKKRNTRRLVREQFNMYTNITPLVQFCQNPAIHEKKCRFPIPAASVPGINSLCEPAQQPDIPAASLHREPETAADSHRNARIDKNTKTDGNALTEEQPETDVGPAPRNTETCLFQAAKENMQLVVDQLFSQLPVHPAAQKMFAGRDLLNHQKEALEGLFSHIDVTGKTVLEIGADEAAVLSHLHEKGMTRGVGINNWYWDDQEHKTVKVTDAVILSWGDIRNVPFADNSFDIILAIAVFEHIQDLQTALKEMHRLLKPGGMVYSYYGPIWSCGVGHHLWFEWDSTWYRFSDPPSTRPILDPYEHLLLDRDQMKKKLEKKWDQPAVDTFLYHIYDNDHINRYMYQDYVNLFEASDFDVIHCEKLAHMDIPGDVKQGLEDKYGEKNDFSCGNLEVILKKNTHLPERKETRPFLQKTGTRVSGALQLCYRALVKRLLVPLFSRKGENNLAIVTRADLFPVDHGAAAKIYHTARVLSFTCDAVFLITLDREKFYIFKNGILSEENYPRWFRTLFYPTEQVLRKKTAAMGIPDDESFLFFPKFDKNFRLRVLYVALQKTVCVYQAEFPFFMDACTWAYRIFGGRRAIVEHNIEFQRLAHTHKLPPEVTDTLKAYEVTLCNAVDHVITVSRNDTRGLIQAGVSTQKICMIPHGVDLENFDACIGNNGDIRQRIRQCHGLSPDDIVLVFHGIYCYPPNQEAAAIIGSRILPALNARGYTPKCLAVGKYPPEQSNHPDLIYTGVVDHVAPYIHAADIGVVPLQDGGGTRMKILEYFAAGIPVVATPKGAEGIGADPGVHILIEEDLDRFVDVLARLLDNPDERHRIGNAGRSFVSRLDWKCIGEQYAALYRNTPVPEQEKPNCKIPVDTTDPGTTDQAATDQAISEESPDLPAQSPGIDHTKAYDYDTLVAEEKKHYAEIEVTEQLTEGGKHAWSAWTYYWECVGQHIHGQAGPYADVVAYLEKTVPRNRPVRVLSLGSGYCGQELILARQFSREYEIVCMDINDDLFAQARTMAARKNLSITFMVDDLNFMKIPPGSYDMIYAHAVLHHVINLEYLFDQIAAGLTDNGFLHLVEVVGKNRRLLWEENETFVNHLLGLCPDDLVMGYRIRATEEEDGMEGVRQQDIMPLLKERFDTRYEYLHGAFMRFVCQHDVIGKNFDPAKKPSKKYLDFLISCDANCIENQLLRPLEVWGIYCPRPSEIRKVSKNE